MTTQPYRDQNMIRSFRGSYVALSNFGGASFAMTDTLDGMSVPNLTMAPTTAEHHFQALKTIVPAEREWVYGAGTARVAKSRGRLITMREDWYHLSLLAMAKVIEAKFSVPANRRVLLSTGDAVLVEGTTWHDQIWGVCDCTRHRGQGENRLGQLLMHERSLIREGAH